MKSVVFAVLTIITMSIAQFSYCMELPPVQEPKRSLEERVARLEQITEKCCKKYTPEYSQAGTVVARAMDRFLKELGSYGLATAEVQAKIKQFTQEALDIEQKLTKGTIILHDAGYIISQAIMQLDNAICAAIIKKYPTQPQIDKFLSYEMMDMTEVRFAISKELSNLRIKPFWDENIRFTCSIPPAPERLL